MTTFRVSERNTLEQPVQEQPVQESPIVRTLCSNQTLIIINPRACTQFDNVARMPALSYRSPYERITVVIHVKQRLCKRLDVNEERS